MYASLASSKDTSLLFPSTLKHSETKLQHKNRETMTSDLHHRHQQQLNLDPMRFRSAPTSLLENYVDGSSGERGEGGCEVFLQPHSSSPEAESMFARFMSSGGGGGAAAAAAGASPSTDLREIGDKSPAVSAATTARAVNQRNSQFMASMEHETEVQNGYSAVSPMLYQAQPPAPMPSQSSATMDNSYRLVNSMAMDHKNSSQVKTASSNSSNLIRHSSSPAGLFSHLTVENGYGLMRGVGNFRGGNGTNREATPATSRLKNQINFSAGSPSSSVLMSQISEIGSESMGANSPDDGSLGNSNSGNRSYMPSFQMGSWDDSALVSENFSGLKRVGGDKMLAGLNPSETQNGEAGNRPPGLAHHFSLPKTSSEIAAMEKFFQLQDSVPCKIRAKRGCATHPRSIAERVRRTRISERMRKLQELVPNMDKQTNTADMLDLAVEYIKGLQKQVMNLTDNQASCICSSKQKPYSSPAV